MLPHLAHSQAAPPVHDTQLVAVRCHSDHGAKVVSCLPLSQVALCHDPASGRQGMFMHKHYAQHDLQGRCSCSEPAMDSGLLENAAASHPLSSLCLPGGCWEADRQDAAPLC